MSWSDHRSKVGGHPVVVGPTVGCRVAVGWGGAVCSVVACTEAIRVGTADAVGSWSMAGIGAGLHA